MRVVQIHRRESLPINEFTRVMVPALPGATAGLIFECLVCLNRLCIGQRSQRAKCPRTAIANLRGAAIRTGRCLAMPSSRSRNPAGPSESIASVLRLQSETAQPVAGLLINQQLIRMDAENLHLQISISESAIYKKSLLVALLA